MESAAYLELRPPAEAGNSVFAALDADNSRFAALGGRPVPVTPILPHSAGCNSIFAALGVAGEGGPPGRVLISIFRPAIRLHPMHAQKTTRTGLYHPKSLPLTAGAYGILQNR